MARIHRPQPWAAQAALIPLPEGARRRVCLVLPNSPSVLLVGSPVDRGRHSRLVLLRRTARRHIRAAAGSPGRGAHYRRFRFLVEPLPVVLRLLRGGCRDLRRLLDDLRAPSLAALVHPRLRPDHLSDHYQVEVSVAINNWRGPFFDLVQAALTKSKPVTNAELYQGCLVFMEIAGVAVVVLALTRFFV